MHDKYIEYILSDQTSIGIAIFAFILVGLYAIDLFIINGGAKRPVGKEGIAVRIVNWLAFGFVFLLFGRIIPLKDVQTWRAAARLALLFLMLSEAIFEVATLIPVIKRAKWMKKI